MPKYISKYLIDLEVESDENIGNISEVSADIVISSSSDSSVSVLDSSSDESSSTFPMYHSKRSDESTSDDSESDLETSSSSIKEVIQKVSMKNHSTKEGEYSSDESNLQLEEIKKVHRKTKEIKKVSVGNQTLDCLPANPIETVEVSTQVHNDKVGKAVRFNRREQILEQSLMACDELIGEVIDQNCSMSSSITEYLNQALYDSSTWDEEYIVKNKAMHSTPTHDRISGASDLNISEIPKTNLFNAGDITMPGEGKSEINVNKNKSCNTSKDEIDLMFETMDSIIMRLRNAHSVISHIDDDIRQNSEREIAQITVPKRDSTLFSGFGAQNEGHKDLLIDNVHNILSRLNKIRQVCREGSDSCVDTGSQSVVNEVSDIVTALPIIKPINKSVPNTLLKPLRVLRSRIIMMPENEEGQQNRE